MVAKAVCTASREDLLLKVVLAELQKHSTKRWRHFSYTPHSRNRRYIPPLPIQNPPRQLLRKLAVVAAGGCCYWRFEDLLLNLEPADLEE